MPLLTLSRARLAFGHHPLLEAADFQLDPANASVSSAATAPASRRCCAFWREAPTWMAARRGSRPARASRMWCRSRRSTADLSVFDAVALGLGAEGRLLTDYHHALTLLTDGDRRGSLARVDALQSQLDESGGWTLSHRVDTVLGKLELPPDRRCAICPEAGKNAWRWRRPWSGRPTCCCWTSPPTISTSPLSHGWNSCCRISMAPSCASATIGASSTQSPRASSSSTAAACSRIRAISRRTRSARPASWKTRRWSTPRPTRCWRRKRRGFRQGVEARRTRNEGRVLRLEALRRERAARRERLGRVNLQLAAGERSGQLVAELLAVSKDYGDGPLIRDFSTRVIRGDRIGLIGPNGAGKSTLLKLILGEIEPDAGTVRRGVNLTVAYFDQLRAQLDPLATLIDTINPGAEFVEIGGKRTHVITYLGDFLFPPERARSPVASLSVASVTGCCSPDYSRNRRTCWFWTNRPTTSTSIRWNCSRQGCRTMPARCSW
jgi:ATP-binding cassette subfamily F protein uup